MNKNPIDSIRTIDINVPATQQRGEMQLISEYYTLSKAALVSPALIQYIIGSKEITQPHKKKKKTRGRKKIDHMLLFGLVLIYMSCTASHHIHWI